SNVPARCAAKSPELSGFGGFIVVRNLEDGVWADLGSSAVQDSAGLFGRRSLRCIMVATFPLLACQMEVSFAVTGVFANSEVCQHDWTFEDGLQLLKEAKDVIRHSDLATKAGAIVNLDLMIFTVSSMLAALTLGTFGANRRSHRQELRRQEFVVSRAVDFQSLDLDGQAGGSELLQIPSWFTGILRSLRGPGRDSLAFLAGASAVRSPGFLQSSSSWRPSQLAMVLLRKNGMGT
ncbi:unnamed protein product, partial [Cladocopium goreaui]